MRDTLPIELSSEQDRGYRLHKPVTDWLETLPHSSDGLNM